MHWLKSQGLTKHLSRSLSPLSPTQHLSPSFPLPLSLPRTCPPSCPLFLPLTCWSSSHLHMCLSSLTLFSSSLSLLQGNHPFSLFSSAPLFREIKQPHTPFQYKLYQECACCHSISQRTPRSFLPTHAPNPSLSHTNNTNNPFPALSSLLQH